MRQILGRFVYNVIISQAGPLTGRPRLSEGGRASQREARPLTGRPGLSQGDRVFNREAGPLTGRQGLSQGGWAYYRDAGPLRGRPGCFAPLGPPLFPWKNRIGRGHQTDGHRDY